MIQLSRGGLELGPGRLLGGLVYGVSLLGLPVWCSVSSLAFRGGGFSRGISFYRQILT